MPMPSLILASLAPVFSLQALPARAWCHRWRQQAPLQPLSPPRVPPTHPARPRRALRLLRQRPLRRLAPLRRRPAAPRSRACLAACSAAARPSSSRQRQRRQQQRRRRQRQPRLRKQPRRHRRRQQCRQQQGPPPLRPWLQQRFLQARRYQHAARRLCPLVRRCRPAGREMRRSQPPTRFQLRPPLPLRLAQQMRPQQRSSRGRKQASPPAPYPHPSPWQRMRCPRPAQDPRLAPQWRRRLQRAWRLGLRPASLQVRHRHSARRVGRLHTRPLLCPLLRPHQQLRRQWMWSRRRLAGLRACQT